MGWFLREPPRLTLEASLLDLDLSSFHAGLHFQSSARVAKKRSDCFLVFRHGDLLLKRVLAWPSALPSDQF
jgi:hypothetical protein